jgi:hypothetical protein
MPFSAPTLTVLSAGSKQFSKKWRWKTHSHLLSTGTKIPNLTSRLVLNCLSDKFNIVKSF